MFPFCFGMNGEKLAIGIEKKDRHSSLRCDIFLTCRLYDLLPCRLYVYNAGVQDKRN